MYGVTHLCFPFSVLDLSSLGSRPHPRGFIRLGSVYGVPQLGSSMSVPDFGYVVSSIPPEGFSRLGSLTQNEKFCTESHGLGREDCRAMTRRLESTGVRDMSTTQLLRGMSPPRCGARCLSSCCRAIRLSHLRTQSGGLPGENMLDGVARRPGDVDDAERGLLHGVGRTLSGGQPPATIDAARPTLVRAAPGFWRARSALSALRAGPARRAAERAVGSAFAPRQAR